MERIFKFNKKRNALIIQMLLMIGISIISFVGFKQTGSWTLFSLLTFSFLLILHYINRIFFIQVKFSENYITYKSLFKKVEYAKHDIENILIYRTNKKSTQREIYSGKNKIEANNNEKIYIVISNKRNQNKYINLVQIANDKRIVVEYAVGMDKYLNQLLTN